MTDEQFVKSQQALESFWPKNTVHELRWRGFMLMLPAAVMLGFVAVYPLFLLYAFLIVASGCVLLLEAAALQKRFFMDAYSTFGAARELA
jgi:hypothetical protein